MYRAASEITQIWNSNVSRDFRRSWNRDGSSRFQDNDKKTSFSYVCMCEGIFSLIFCTVNRAQLHNIKRNQSCGRILSYGSCRFESAVECMHMKTINVPLRVMTFGLYFPEMSVGRSLYRAAFCRK